VQLFYLINGWAGRNDFADATLRFFYVGAVPALATLLAALLILAPRLHKAPSRGRTVGAALLAIVLCGLAMGGVNAFASHYLGTNVLSPRPFVTRYVHLLVVEPNDNSFPCPEVMVAGALAALLYSVAPSVGILSWLAVFVLGFARVFCGSNYVADSLIGALLGGMLATLSLAIWRVPLQIPLRGGQRLVWRLGHQAVLSGVGVLAVAAYAVGVLGPTSPYKAKLARLLREPTAIAAPTNVDGSKPATSYATKGMGATHEGEGIAPVEAGQPLLSSSAARLDGHLPDDEKKLQRMLRNLGLPHRIIGVNVAQVRAGTSAYRCAVVRFEVSGRGFEERRKVTDTAAAIVKNVFWADTELQNIDVLGVVLRDANADNTRDLAGDKHILESGVVPVFTATITRPNLQLAKGPQWLNWDNANAGLWLRARSQLYFNDQILPPVATAPAATAPTPTPVPTVTTPKWAPPLKPAAPAKVPAQVLPGKKPIPQPKVTRRTKRRTYRYRKRSSGRRYRRNY